MAYPGAFNGWRLAASDFHYRGGCGHGPGALDCLCQFTSADASRDRAAAPPSRAAQQAPPSPPLQSVPQAFGTFRVRAGTYLRVDGVRRALYASVGRFAVWFRPAGGGQRPHRASAGEPWCYDFAGLAGMDLCRYGHSAGVDLFGSLPRAAREPGAGANHHADDPQRHFRSDSHHRGDRGASQPWGERHAAAGRCRCDRSGHRFWCPNPGAGFNHWYFYSD